MKTNRLEKSIIYENLRNEMHEEFKRQDTYILSGYTATIALWTIALQTKNFWIAIIPCIILLPLSMRICDLKYCSTFLSSFIAVYLENDIEYGWESLREKYYDMFPRNKGGILLTFFSRFGFSILSIVSIFLFWFLVDFNISFIGSLFWGHVIIFAQIFIIIVQFFVCWKYSNTSKIKKPLLDNWRLLYEDLMKKEQS